MQNTIDDQKFREAWADPDNIRTMKHVAKPYRKYMEQEEWEQLMRMGLLNTLRSHDYSGRRKFISSLRLRTLWVFKTNARGMLRKLRLKEKIRKAPPGRSVTESVEESYDVSDVIATYLEELDPEEKTVITHRYLENLSFSEISRRLGMSRARVGNFHKSGMVKLRYLAMNRENAHVDCTRSS